jgi:hypothetical protein
VISGFDILGAEPPRQPISLKRTLVALGAGAVGALLVPKHPVLAFLGIAAAASNTHAVLAEERTMKQAIQRMGRHIVATVGSLSVPKFPAMGYVAGAVAADLFIDGEGGGIIEEFTDYEGIRSSLRGDVIDAEFTETKSPGVALQKVT